jgi:hypothetical protein
MEHRRRECASRGSISTLRPRFLRAEPPPSSSVVRLPARSRGSGGTLGGLPPAEPGDVFKLGVFLMQFLGFPV